jgi:hypothetical protein
MIKCNMGGHDFYCERIPTYEDGDFKGASIFAVKDKVDAEVDLYWVVIPLPSDWEKGCSSPDKGHVVCMCREAIDARMVAMSINLAFAINDKVGDIESLIKNKLKILEDTYDTDAMASEVDRLHKESKSDTEIIETMKSKRESFLRKKPAKNGGEW